MHSICTATIHKHNVDLQSQVGMQTETDGCPQLSGQTNEVTVDALHWQQYISIHLQISAGFTLLLFIYVAVEPKLRSRTIRQFQCHAMPVFITFVVRNNKKWAIEKGSTIYYINYSNNYKRCSVKSF